MASECSSCVTRKGRRDAALSGRTLLEGDSFDLPGTQRTVVYERFAPTVDKQSGMPTADPRVNDPAVALTLSQEGETLGEALGPAWHVDRPGRRLARSSRSAT